MNELREIYKIEQLPVFQNRMFDTEREAQECTKGNVFLVQDLQTGLIFNQAFRSELVDYDHNYQNEQAVSNYFQVHLDAVGKIVEQHIGKIEVVEVGCGKAHFLELLANRGFEIIGFDPVYEGDNSSIRKEYFDINAGIQAKGIILRHVLEHVSDPLNFLRNIRDANSGTGRIYIEVPCFDWISQHRAWFDVYYEHVNYFRISDFHRMFSEVIESGHLFGNQYIYVVADLSKLRTPIVQSGDCFSLPSDFLNMISNYSSIAHAEKKHGKRVAIWGGASKGVIFALLMERAGVKVDAVIDVNPAKQGKYMPGTGMKIISHQDAVRELPEGTLVFVMNSNYLQEIKELSKNYFQYKGVDHE